MRRVVFNLDAESATVRPQLLERYLEIVEQYFPGWRIIALFLTPDGIPSSHKDYLPVGYGSVCNVIDTLAESRASLLSSDLKALMTHYTDMLKRNIVGDSEIAKLCRQIYQQHKKALDLIFEHRPDHQQEIRDVAEDLVKKEPKFWLHDGSGKSKIKFGIVDWDRAPALSEMVWFEIWNFPNSLELKIFVGPGDEGTRHRLHEIVRNNPDIFIGASSRLGNKWSNVFSRPWQDRRG